MTNALSPSLGVKFCGQHLETPLVLLAGSVGFGNEYTRIEGFSYRDVGMICLNGTTVHAREGYAAHRLSETTLGLFSATGWPNPGVDAVIKDVLPKIECEGSPVCANVCGATLNDFVEVTRRFDQSSVAAIELNLSSLELDAVTKEGSKIEECGRVVEACRSVTSKPLIIKLSADTVDMGVLARHCIEAGANALSLIHPVPAMAINIESRRQVLAHGVGGLSGPAVKPIALLKVMQVAEVARPHGVAIIGQGGIRTAEDAIEFLIAGADLVGVCTGLYYDPLVCPKINSGIQAYLQRHDLSSVSQLSGSLQKN